MEIYLITRSDIPAVIETMELLAPILNSPILQFIIALSQNLGPFIFFLFLGVIIFCIFKSDFFKMATWIDVLEFIRVRGHDTGKLEKRWQHTVRRLESPNMADWKLAVIEAENLTEEVLARMGFNGESFGERLKRMRADQLPSLDNLTNAHQIRNNIVHDPDYRIDIGEASKTIAIYEKSLQELDAL